MKKSERLTERQKAVLSMAMTGMTRPEACRVLGITKQGLARHLHLMEKKGVVVIFERPKRATA